MSDEDAVHYGALDDGTAYLSKPVGEWSDEDITVALAQIEHRAICLDRILATYTEIHAQLNAEHNRRAELYRAVAEAISTTAPKET